MSIEVEYSPKYIVGKDVHCHLAYIVPLNSRCGMLRTHKRRKWTLVWLMLLYYDDLQWTII